MDSKPPIQEKPPFIVAVYGLFVLFSMCFSLVPYALLAFHHQFLPSPKYLVDVKYLSLMSGLVCALPGAFLLSSSPLDEKGDGITSRMFVPIFGSIMLFIFGHQLVTMLVPTIAAAISRQDVEIIYVVNRPESISTRFCNTPIILEYMPSYGDELCNFPPAFRQQLSPGSEIVVTGHGTSWGLFVGSARLANASEAETP